MQDHYARNITYLRISLTDRCNLRCRYCMPEEGINKLCHSDVLRFEEILEITAACASLGIKKVRLTGGEPLIRRGCISLCREIAALPGIEELAMTTNGLLLPDYARELKEAGLQRVNISLDTLSPEKFRHITGGGSLERVLEGIKAAIDADLTPVKLNTVLIGGFNDDEIPALAAMTREYPVDLRFIELMPMGPGAEFDERAFLSGQAVLDALPELTPEAEDGGVARLYRLPGAKGRIGLISPLSNHFCGSCNRLRLTSEGALKPCLHSNQEIPLRGLHGEALKNQILSAIAAKPQQHGLLDAHHSSEAGRAMNTIGG